MTDKALEVAYLKPDELYAEENENWRTIWDESKGKIKALADLIGKFVYVPYPSIQLPLAAMYSFASSKWSKVLPILFCYGEKGTGKSTIAKIASRLHDTPMCSANDTFASLRNKLNQRWLDEEQNAERDGVLLAWDNIYCSTFEADTEKRIYAMFLYGYDRSSDRISIANRDGSNSVFRTFCPKIISSVEALHTNPSFSELQRRLLMIYHKPIKRITDEEREGRIFDSTELLDFDYYSWDDFSSTFDELWTNLEFIRLYTANRKRILASRYRPIERDKWIIAVDLICVGLTLDFFDTIKEGVDFFVEVFNLQSKYSSGNRTATYENLKAFIEEETSFLEEQNAILVSAGKTARPVIIPARKVKDKVAYLANEGALDTKADTKTIVSVMAELGYKLTGRGWLKL